MLHDASVFLKAIEHAFEGVAFATSLIVTILFGLGVVWYGKRRPVDAELTWGQAMAACVYVTAGMIVTFAILPDRWMAHAQGDLNMRSDAVLIGHGSHGIFPQSPIIITKGTIADLVGTTIYIIGFMAVLRLWRFWQTRGQKVSDEVEKSTYGRPLVKA